MKTLEQPNTIQLLQGFTTYRLANDDVELTVVPELGAKIISLKNLRTGREWMWHPPAGLKLFKNHAGDDFSKSPLVGADECLPTITPCSWQGRILPDHGEVWNAPWRVDSAAWENGILTTSIRLKISPLELIRTIELTDNEIRLGYRLNNLGAAPEFFLWALHPLLQLQPDDQLILPRSTRDLVNNSNWTDTIAAAAPEKGCAKIFATPVHEGWAAIKNETTGDQLKFLWSPLETDTLGLWLTRGGWHGHHHFAIEPTNSASDSLAVAARQNHCGIVPPNDFATWQIRLHISPNLFPTL